MLTTITVITLSNKKDVSQATGHYYKQYNAIKQLKPEVQLKVL